MAGLPTGRAIVNVGPPLFVSGPTMPKLLSAHRLWFVSMSEPVRPLVGALPTSSVLTSEVTETGLAAWPAEPGLPNVLPLPPGPPLPPVAKLRASVQFVTQHWPETTPPPRPPEPPFPWRGYVT